MAGDLFTGGETGYGLPDDALTLYRSRMVTGRFDCVEETYDEEAAEMLASIEDAVEGRRVYGLEVAVDAMKRRWELFEVTVVYGDEVDGGLVGTEIISETYEKDASRFEDERFSREVDSFNEEVCAAVAGEDVLDIGFVTIPGRYKTQRLYQAWVLYGDRDG